MTMNVVQELGFRSPQVCRLAGISYRQLDYWARTGLLAPSLDVAHGSGSQRRYSKADVVCARIVKVLRGFGYVGYVSGARPVIALVRAQWDRISESSCLLVSPAEVRLLIDPLDVAALAFATSPQLLVPMGPLLDET